MTKTSPMVTWMNSVKAMTDDTKDILYEVEGQDLWVSVTVIDDEILDCYMKVLSIVDGIVSFIYIRTSVVEGSEIDDEVIYWELTSFNSIDDDIIECPIDKIAIVYPLDVMTTEEILHLTEYHNENWEDNYGDYEL